MARRGLLDPARTGELWVVGEASDGTEALQLAKELRPALILLDISLPKLDGIEVAKRLLQLLPEAKIIFLTQNDDPEGVRAALSTGAHGYVLKTDAESELIPAVAALSLGDSLSVAESKGGDSGEADNRKKRPRDSNESTQSSCVVPDGLRGFMSNVPNLLAEASISVCTANRRNSVSGIANSVKPQFIQTTIFGNTKTWGVVKPGKWMAISVGNLLWFSEVHSLQAMAPSYS